MITNITKIDINYLHKENPLRSSYSDGVQHIKSLPWFSIAQATEGSYKIQIDNSPQYKTGEGGFFLAPSQAVQNIIHCVNPNTNRMNIRWIFIDVIINKKYRLDDLYSFPIVLQPKQKEHLNALFDELFQTKDCCSETIVCYKIIQFLLSIATPKNNPLYETLLPVINFINANYAQNISIKQLADAAHISESALYAAFQKQFHTSPIAYLNHYRLTLASNLLCQTSLPIQDIALSVGFTDAFYFSRLFKKTFNLSPREYRKTNP